MPVELMATVIARLGRTLDLWVLLGLQRPEHRRERDAGAGQGSRTLQARLAQALTGQWRDRVAPRERVNLLRTLGNDDARIVFVLPDPGDGQGNGGEHADHDERRHPGVLSEEGQLGTLDECHRYDPEQGNRDKELPAETHE